MVTNPRSLWLNSAQTKKEKQRLEELIEENRQAIIAAVEPGANREALFVLKGIQTAREHLLETMFGEKELP